jgi:hypothetical protein
MPPVAHDAPFILGPIINWAFKNGYPDGAHLLRRSEFTTMLCPIYKLGSPLLFKEERGCLAILSLNSLFAVL